MYQEGCSKTIWHSSILTNSLLFKCNPLLLSWVLSFSSSLPLIDKFGFSLLKMQNNIAARAKTHFDCGHWVCTRTFILTINDSALKSYSVQNVFSCSGPWDYWFKHNPLNNKLLFAMLVVMQCSHFKAFSVWNMHVWSTPMSSTCLFYTLLIFFSLYLWWLAVHLLEMGGDPETKMFS